MAEVPTKGTEQAGFALVLEPAAGANRVIGGLPLALRLALDAQAAGAEIVVVPENQTSLRSLLADPRLRLNVVGSPPSHRTGAGLVARSPGDISRARRTASQRRRA
jgi:hypothetical protein